MDMNFERLVSLIITKLKYVILIAVVISLGTYLICDNIVEKKYTSESVLMIQMNPQSNQSTNNELSVTKQSVENYIRTLYTYNFFRYAAESVNSELGTNYTEKQLLKSSTIKASSSDKSSSDFIFTFTSTTPELAQKILFIITEEATSYLDEKNATNPVDRIEDPSLPVTPSYPRTKTLTIYSFLFSAILSVCVFFFIEIFDDRIKNVKDITSAYTITILGVIPNYDQPKVTKGRKNSYANSYSKEEKKNG